MHIKRVGYNSFTYCVKYFTCHYIFFVLFYMPKTTCTIYCADYLSGSRTEITLACGLFIRSRNFTNTASEISRPRILGHNQVCRFIWMTLYKLGVRVMVKNRLWLRFMLRLGHIRNKLTLYCWLGRHLRHAYFTLYFAK